MSWDKPKFEKKKTEAVEGMDHAYAELGKRVHAFFTNNPGEIYISAFTGIGDAVEFGAFKLYHTTEGDKVKMLADDKSLFKVLKKTEKILDCTHDFEYDTGWCRKCNVHKTVLS